MLLAIDTSSATTLVVLCDESGVRAALASGVSGGHERVVAVLIAQALVEADAPASDVDSVACGVGPGPFTGLRVGVMAALAFGRAVEAPVFGFCSLDIVAWSVAHGANPPPAFVVAADARRKEVYWATYTADGRRTSEPAVGIPAAVAELIGELPVAGPGSVIYAPFFPRGIEPSAATCEALAGLVGTEWERLAPTPLYLRPPDVAVPGPRKPVTQ